MPYLSLVESYVKLICGTKDKAITEIDFAKVLDKINYKHELL